jgi:anti-sigma regulatory factor (Ser/Thr protein kinase)
MKYFELVISNEISELGQVEAAIEKLSESWGLMPKVGMNINLVLEEIISNTIFYGYNDDIDHKIVIEFTLGEGYIEIEISDDAAEFDIAGTGEFKDVDKSVDERKIGGLGIHFVKTLMDKLEYRREENRNIITLTKKL